MAVYRREVGKKALVEQYITQIGDWMHGALTAYFTNEGRHKLSPLEQTTLQKWVDNYLAMTRMYIGIIVRGGEHGTSKYIWSLYNEWVTESMKLWEDVQAIYRGET